MLALWDFHDFLYLLENGNLAQHHNSDIHGVLVKELRLRNLSGAVGTVKRTPTSDLHLDVRNLHDSHSAVGIILAEPTSPSESLFRNLRNRRCNTAATQRG